MGSTAPSLKKLMRTHVAPMIMTCPSPKRKVVPGATQKATTRRRLRRTRPSAAQVNDSHFLQTDVQFFLSHFYSQLTSIASQSTLGAGQLSQALDPSPTEPSSQEKPISVEATDAFTMAKNVNFILDIRWSTFLLISWFARLSNLYLIICHARHLLRKYPCKSRGLAVHLLTTIPSTLGIVPLLILILPIP